MGMSDHGNTTRSEQSPPDNGGMTAHQQDGMPRGLLQTIFDAAPVGIAYFDRDMRLVDFNAEYRTLTDPRIALSLGEVLYEVYPASLARKPIYDRVFAGESVDQKNVAYPYSDEEVRYRDARYRPVRDANGQVIGLVSAIVDVTDNKRAVEALRESEARFRAVADLVPDFLWSRNAEGNIEWYNQRWIEYTGQSSEESAGLGWLRVLHPEDTEESLEGLQTALATGESLRQERRIRGTDGSYRWFLVQMQPLHNEKGEIVHWFGAATDVHEQRRAREELEDLVRERTAELAESEAKAELQLQRLNDIFRLIPAGVAVMSGPEHRYELANPTFLRTMNKREEDVIGKSVREVFPEGIAQGWIDVADTIYRSGEPRLAHEALAWLDRQGDGNLEETYWNAVTMPLRDANGQVEGIMTESVEVTDQVLSRRRIEGLLIEREEEIAARKVAEEELRVSNAHLRGLSGRLLAVQEEERRTVARELHDEIGQQLTALRYILDRPQQPYEGKAIQVSDALVILDSLTDRVRELSLDLRPSMLDDAGLWPGLLWHTERYTSQTGIYVNLAHRGLQERLPAAVETAIYRIVQEALTNVARHADVQQVTVQLMVDSTVTLLIEEAGKGFDVDEALARHTSAGLSGMRERVELLGGQFTIEAEIDKGTRIMAEIPLDDFQQESQPGDTEEESEGTGPKPWQH
jgi:PAS domain S-box-containing protein